MQLGGEPQKVTLKSGLTKYNSKCVVGSEGKTIPNKAFGTFGKFDHFVAVKFDNGAEMDVAYSSLKIEE